MPEGKVAVVPDDGLTMRERRAAAAGGAHRRRQGQVDRRLPGWPCGPGRRVGRSGCSSSPRAPSGGWARRCPQGPRGVPRRPPGTRPVTWHKMGAGWSWLRTQPEDHARAAREAGGGSSVATAPRPTGWWCWTSSPTRSPTAPSTSPSPGRARPSRRPARRRHRPAGRPHGRRGRPGHRHDQGQAPRWTPAARARPGSSG